MICEASSLINYTLEFNSSESKVKAFFLFLELKQID